MWYRQWFRHRGCVTPVVEYRSDLPLVGPARIRHKDWFGIDGLNRHEYENRTAFKCPDCGTERLLTNGRAIVECDAPNK